MAYGFVSFTSDFSYLYSKEQTPCTYVWRHKDVKAQRVDHVATRYTDVKISHTQAKHVK